MTETKPPPEPLVDWRMIAAVGLWSLTGLVAVVLVGRALAGAFDAPVGAFVPGLVTGVATIGSLWAWTLFGRSQDRSPSKRPRVGRRLAIGWASLAAPALIAWATTVSASSLSPGLVTGILVLGLTAVVVCEGVRIAPLAEPAADDNIAVTISDPSPSPMAPSPMAPSPMAEHAAVAPVTHRSDTFDSEDSESEDSEMVQQCSRRREPDGTERIEAVLLATFAPGERETALHLPIHPVLCAGPHVECEPLDGDPLDGNEVTAAVTAAYPYGVRIEVRRTSSLDDGLSVPIGIEIVATRPAVNVA